MTRVRRLLAVFAHPDDETFLAGGTLALHAAAGWEVTIVCATRGESGRRGPYTSHTQAEFAAVREAELREAARELGVTEVRVLGYPDQGVQAQQAAGEQAVADLLRAGPRDVVLTFGPDGISGHADHVAVSDIVTNAVRRLGATPEAGSPPAPQLYYVLRSAAVPPCCRPRSAVRPPPVTTFVEVGPVVDRKLRAMRAHRSQIHLQPDEVGLEERLRAPECFHRAQPAWTSEGTETVMHFG